MILVFVVAASLTGFGDCVLVLDFCRADFCLICVVVVWVLGWGFRLVGDLPWFGVLFVGCF